MRLADAFEIVLDLAEKQVCTVPKLVDSEVIAQQRLQKAAIAKVEEFVRTCDFDDAPETTGIASSDSDIVYARVDFRTTTGPKDMYVRLQRNDLETDYNGKDAIYRLMRAAGKNTDSIIGWSFYEQAEIEGDPSLADLVASWGDKPVEPESVGFTFPLPGSPKWQRMVMDKMRDDHEED